MKNWWMRWGWIRSLWNRRKMGSFLLTPPVLTPQEQRQSDLRAEEWIAETYADRSGYTVEWVAAEVWAERFNALPPDQRLAHRDDPTPDVAGFIEPVAPYRKLVCCHRRG